MVTSLPGLHTQGSSRRGTWRLRVMGLVAGLLSISILVAIIHPDFATCARSGYYDVKVIALGEDRAIRIRAQCWWEMNQLVAYEVYDSGRVVQESFPFGGVTEDPELLRFSTLTAREGDVVGLFEPQMPEVILVLHDFGTGESWPCEWHEGYEAVRERGHRMLDQLKRDNPGVDLQLSYDVACSNERNVCP
jgi:hypothetical protein